MRERRVGERIIAPLNDHAAEPGRAGPGRRRGISDATFHTWRLGCGGMAPGDAKRLRSHEKERAQAVEPTLRPKGFDDPPDQGIGYLMVSQSSLDLVMRETLRRLIQTQTQILDEDCG